MKSLFFEDDILTVWRHQSSLARWPACEISPLIQGELVGATLRLLLTHYKSTLSRALIYTRHKISDSATEREDRQCNHGNSSAFLYTTQRGQKKVARRSRSYSHRCRTDNETQVSITTGGEARRRRTRDTQGKTRLPKQNRK